MKDLSSQDVSSSAVRSATFDSGMVTPARRDTDVSPAADEVHKLGELAGSKMPRICPVDDPDYHQNAGLEASNNKIYLDILNYLEAICLVTCRKASSD